MDYEELDEAEKKRRKEEAVAYREKKRNSTIFLSIATIFSILETLIIIFVLFIAESFVCFKLLNLQDTGNLTGYAIVMIFLFIGGIIVGHLIYLKVIRWSIKKWNLKEKLSDDLINHYKTKKELLAEKGN